jgi:hypothetical protein
MMKLSSSGILPLAPSSILRSRAKSAIRNFVIEGPRVQAIVKRLTVTEGQVG